MWTSRMTLAALVGAAVIVGATGGEVEARKKKHAEVSSKKKKASKKTKKKASKKVAKQEKRKPNMPPGWSWPPNRAMKEEGQACLDDLDALGVKWEKAGKTKKVATPVVVPAMEFGGIKVKSWWRSGPHVMDCHLARGLATYAPKLYDLGVRTITFSSIYRYDTHITAHGVRSKALSRHALGLAMDVHSFTDAAGNEAVVKDDYLDGNELLLGIEEFVNDSGGFRTVLTPRNDPESHDDHFHLEVKVDYTTPREKKPSS
jgi:hypothetical protein